MKQIILNVLFLLILTGCGGGFPTFVDPSYKNIDFSQQDITISLPDEIYVANDDDYVDDFKQVLTYDNVRIQIGKILNQYKSIGTKPINVISTEISYGEDLKKKINNQMVLYKDIVDLTTDANFHIDFQYLSYSKEQGTPGTWHNGVYSGGRPAGLIANVTYAVWSTKDKKIIAYGEVATKSSFNFYMDVDNWEMATHSLVTIILKTMTKKRIKQL